MYITSCKHYKRSIDDYYSTHYCRNRYCDEILKVFAIIMCKNVYIVITWREKVYLKAGEPLNDFSFIYLM